MRRKIMVGAPLLALGVLSGTLGLGGGVAAANPGYCYDDYSCRSWTSIEWQWQHSWPQPGGCVGECGYTQQFVQWRDCATGPQEWGERYEWTRFGGIYIRDDYPGRSIRIEYLGGRDMKVTWV